MAMTSIPTLHDTKYDSARRGKGTKLAVALAVLFFLLASCRPGHYPQSLLVADSLCAAHPQRALEWLDSLRPRMEQERKGVRMYYDLLCIKAQDKAYIPHASDSLILSVLHYYEERADRRHLPEAYYYAGRVTSDLGDAPQALDYFGKALEAMPEGAMTDLRSRVVSQMGTLFYRQRMYPEALEMYKQSLACDSVRRDSVGMAFSLRDVGAVYYILGDVGSALSYYLRAYEICRIVPSSGVLGSIEDRIAGLYMSMQRPDSAKHFLQAALRDGDRMERPGICVTAGTYYQKQNELDSAAWYYREVLRYGSIYLNKIAYGNLAQILLARGNPDAAIQYLRKANDCADSIQRITNTEGIRQMNALYNYQLREKENIRLRADNALKKRNLIYLSVLTGIILLVAIWYFRSRRKNWMARLQLLEQLQQESYRKSTQCIHDNEEEIRRLKAALQNKEDDLWKSQTCRKELEQQIEILTTANKQVKLEQNRRQLAEELLFNSDIYRHFKQQLKVADKKLHLSLKDWEALRMQVDRCYDNFTQKLNGPYQLDDRELRICLLIKTRFSCKDIGSLINMSQSGVSSVRSRLYSKVFNKKGNAKGWDDFILSL